MTCDEVREYLFAFLDNEIDAALSIELQRHLDGCAGCAREAEIERTIGKRLAAELHDSGLECGDLDGAVKTVQCLRQRAVSWSGTRCLQAAGRWRWWSAAAAVLAIGAGAWLTMPHDDDNPSSGRFADLLAGDFDHYLQVGGKPQIVSDDRDAVTKWLRDKTALAVALPALDPSAYRLIGGRKCKIEGRAAAFAVYDVKGVRASMVAVAADPWSLDGMSAIRYQGSICLTDRCRGYTVVACRRGALVYAAVSTLAREDLLGLITGAVHESH